MPRIYPNTWYKVEGGDATKMYSHVLVDNLEREAALGLSPIPTDDQEALAYYHKESGVRYYYPNSGDRVTELYYPL